MNTHLFPLPAPDIRPLNSLELARLKSAGTGAPELRACTSIHDEDQRELLIEFFCDACPHNWRKLALMVALMRWKVRRGDVRAIGGDIITNAAKFHFPECEGNNDFRLLYPRALAIVCPELRALGVLAMDSDAKANVLFECGWEAPGTVDWKSVAPVNLGDYQP